MLKKTTCAIVLICCLVVATCMPAMAAPKDIFTDHSDPDPVFPERWTNTNVSVITGTAPPLNTTPDSDPVFPERWTNESVAETSRPVAPISPPAPAPAAVAENDLDATPQISPPAPPSVEPTTGQYRLDLESTTYYNGVAGLAFTPVSGWYYTIDQSNMSTNARSTGSLSDLDLVDYYDGGYGVLLADMESRISDGDDNHSNLMAVLEYYPRLTNTDSYISFNLENYYLDDNNGFEYTFLSRTTTTLYGKEFTRLVIRVDNEKNDTPYIEENFIMAIDESQGLYLNLYVNYWLNGGVGQAEVYEALQRCVRLY